ncbi:MAG TPA: oligosaccharide flippase family protein [Clostridia bacterium]
MNSLAKNSVYNIFYKLLNIVFPLLTSAYVARILLPDGVGKVAYALNIVQYFLLVAALGLPNYGTREIARVRDDRNKLNSLFSELFIINAISTTICILAYYSLISYLPVAKQIKHFTF